MKHQAVFLYDPASDVAVLSGGAWQLPLDRLKTDDMAKVARSVDLDPASTVMRATFADPEFIRAVALGSANLTNQHFYRVTAYADAFATPIADTGFVQSIPPGGQAGMDWFDPEFWFGAQAFRDSERAPGIVHIFDEPVTAAWWQIEILDPDNPDGYVDLTRLFLARGWRPKINYAHEGNAFSFRDNSQRAATLSGGTQVRGRRNPRRFRCALPYTRDREGWNEAYRLFAVAGFDDLVFVIPDPRDAENKHKRSFFGRIVQADPLTQAIHGRLGTAFELEEII